MPMLSFRISDDLAARVDEAAAGNRSAWIKRALEQALGEGLSTGEAVADARPPASARVSAPDGARAPVDAVSESGPVPVDRVTQFRRAELLRRGGN